MGKIIAVCNQKGGVGKTTTSVNLTASLGASGAKILLIDLDPQANATSGLGIDKKNIKYNVYHVLIESQQLCDVILDSGFANLFIAPSDTHLTGAQLELVNAFNREHRLKNSLASISHNYDFIFIDCPPSLGLLTINALTAANTILIPLQCEFYAMEGLSQLLQTVKLVQDHLNPTLDIEGVVLTMADYRTNLTNEVVAEAKNFFKNKIYDTVIPRSIRLSEAPGHGKPAIVYDKNSNGAMAYQQLATEFLNRNNFNNNKMQEINESIHIKSTTESVGMDSQNQDTCQGVNTTADMPVEAVPDKAESDGGGNG